jgi:bacterioferritin-associated ferredoxin
MSSTPKEFNVSLPGRETASLLFSLNDDGSVSNARLTGVGGPLFLKLLGEWRPQIKGKLSELPIPKGKSLGEILLRELFLRAKGEWNFPYNEQDVCHCRVIPTAIVDAAIVCGAHTPREVSEQTSASTACGTCRPDVEAMIKYRLGA